MFTNLHSYPMTGTAIWKLHHISENHLQRQFLINLLSLCIQQQKLSFTHLEIVTEDSELINVTKWPGPIHNIFL